VFRLPIAAEWIDEGVHRREYLIITDDFNGADQRDRRLLQRARERDEAASRRTP
jgi:hypothetical protein